IWMGGSWTNNGGAFIPSASTVTFASTNTGQKITSNKNNFSYVQFNGSGGYWTLQDSITVGLTLTLTNGNVDSGANQAIWLGGSWWNNGGSYLPNASTVTFASTNVGQKIINGKSNFSFVQFNGSGGYWTLQDSMTVVSSMTLTNGTLDSGSNQ